MIEEIVFPERGEAVEILRFQVDSHLVETFIELDHQWWTKALAAYPGFVSKDVWVNDKKPGEVTTIIYWNSLEEWKSIDHDELLEIDRKFSLALEGASFTIEALHEGNDYKRVRHTKLI